MNSAVVHIQSMTMARVPDSENHEWTKELAVEGLMWQRERERERKRRKVKEDEYPPRILSCPLVGRVAVIES
jgi:hypothetical protein